jgi:alginate O-acetyltransferase complex protein AlgI
MLFCSSLFLAYFALVAAIYWALPSARARIWLLLVASVVFYSAWSRWLAALVCGTAVLDFFIARELDRKHASPGRTALLILSVAVNLGVLIYFKYANFFLDSLRIGLRAAGVEATLPALSVIVPIGISFYTFESISYTVDVYRRRIRAEQSLAHFLLFILFFPHLIAGPIVRGRDFLPQIARPKRWSWPRAYLGLQLFVLGAFKKSVLADRLALYVDPVFSNPGHFGTTTLVLATLAWAGEVFCDFSGYTDMAIGCAHLLGYKLTKNFDLPYLAANISDFWRRWHISLSRWLRDYLFIPLGGSRGSRWMTARNLMITMTLGGLWHGASWPYVVFGVLQGMLLTGHRAFRGFCDGRPRLAEILATRAGTALRVATTFTVFCGTLVIFRAPTVAAGLGMLRAILIPRGGAGLPVAPAGLWLALTTIAVGHAMARQRMWPQIAARAPAPIAGFGYAMALMMVLLLAPGSGRAFVYFQF